MEQVILLVVVSMFIGSYLQSKIEEGLDFIGAILFILYTGTFLYLLVKGFLAVLG